MRKGTKETVAHRRKIGEAVKKRGEVKRRPKESVLEGPALTKAIDEFLEERKKR